jgi:hypothetical protein
VIDGTFQEAQVELPSDRSVRPEEPAAGFPGTDRPEIDRVLLTTALDRLVDRGVLDRTQADAVVTELGGPPSPRPEGLRRRLGEIAGYLGASFVVGATLLFLGEEWDALGRGGRFAILAIMAAILFGSGVAVRRRVAPPGAHWWRPWAGDSMRRRLSSTLLTGAAVAVSFAVYVILEVTGQTYPDPDDDARFVASVAGLAVVIAGYLLARSALGQLGIAVAAFASCGTLLDLLDAEEMEAFGFSLLALAAVWVVLAWRRLVTEHRFALAIAVTFGLIGAQLVVIGDSETQNYLGYALTALVAGICFAAYARIREWVVLAGGVVGATLVVPEFLYDVTDGSLGASGVMLVAGVTLLAGSLAGLRIRRNPDPDSPPTGTGDNLTGSTEHTGRAT